MDWAANPERVASSILLTVEKPAAWRREWTGRGGDATLTGLAVLAARSPRVSFVPRNPGLGDAIPSRLPGMFRAPEKCELRTKNSMDINTLV